jgi:probable F420-dependent oxidoreductase
VSPTYASTAEVVVQFWCGTAFMSTPELPAVAQMLDEAGYHGIMVSDHLIFPRELSSPYPSPTGRPFWAPETAWPDTWVLIGAMAAVSTTLHFSNAVYIAPARPLLEVAKHVATASVLSGGRVSLAVGAGWMREEFELLDQDFDNRGRRLDEMIEALRALWQGGWVSWAGTYYRIPELMLEPHPEQPVPILCGGESEVALRRAARSCDGWVGTGYPLDEAARYVEKLHEYRREYGREHDPFEVILALFDPPSPDLYQPAEEIGVTGVMCAPWAGVDDIHAGAHDALKQHAERYRAPIERFAEEIVTKCR